MNEIDELKNQWSQTSLRLSQLEQDNARLTAELRESRMRPSLHRLASSYGAMAITALIMLGITYPFFYLVWAKIWPAPVTWPVIFWTVLFTICAIEDSYLYFSVKKINVATMSVEEVSQRAIKCRKTHLIFQCTLIPIAIAFLVTLFTQAPEGRPGMIVGGLIGLCIGIRKWLQIMRAYRQLI